jgi:hypothetical protein
MLISCCGCARVDAAAAVASDGHSGERRTGHPGIFPAFWRQRTQTRERYERRVDNSRLFCSLLRKGLTAIAP